MTKIKICGVRQAEHALAAAQAGADYIGAIFAPMSSRRVTPAQAKAVAEALRSHGEGGSRPLLVGVFVNESPAEMNRLADFCCLDLVQLSGDEPWEVCHRLTRPAIKALRVRPDRAVAEVVTELGRELPGVHRLGGLCLLEGQVEGRYGGTGQRMDWELAAATAVYFPFLLSGGLNPDNVGDAVRRVRPWGVDVSSGVETDGLKDPHKIRAFIRTVKSADVVE